MRRRSLQDILDNYCPEPNTGCHLWTGATSPDGYGVIDKRRVLGERVITRILWAYERGPIAAGLKVCHRCDTPRCINIRHLFLGTQRENIIDMRMKRRNKRGSQCRLSKLTEESVRAMRADYSAGGVTTRDLAKRYGVGPTVAFLVVTNQRWRHVT